MDADKHGRAPQVLAGGNVRETNETTLQGPRGVQVVSQYYFAGLAARPWWYGAATTGLEGPAWVGALTAARATIAGELRGLVERDAIEYVRRAAISPMNRGDAAAGTWRCFAETSNAAAGTWMLFRGDEERRGRDVDVSRRRATPRP